VVTGRGSARLWPGLRRPAGPGPTGRWPDSQRRRRLRHRRSSWGPSRSTGRSPAPAASITR